MGDHTTFQPERAAYDRAISTPAKLQTARRRSRRRVLAAIIKRFKEGPCADCGGKFDPVCMDFDHRPGETKLFNVGAAPRNNGIDSLMHEIAKCDVVCANCHRLRTKNRGLNV